ncbi:DUF4236 domain-containing protein [Xanthomonas sp. 3498]|uniref:DUF4236 domain-containing protein n=1 Tax=Xanthomonas sp. 3498 TaxID=2663863 RepID=UPI00160E2178|nr:DUF4236 domain-containing protein [Xanthomonas sp. 3498]
MVYQGQGQGDLQRKGDGFYLRKSVRVGAFRFNVSKGVVGVSVGIKGLQVGSRPRGNYLHFKTFYPS